MLLNLNFTYIFIAHIVVANHVTLQPHGMTRTQTRRYHPNGNGNVESLNGHC